MRALPCRAAWLRAASSSVCSEDILCRCREDRALKQGQPSPAMQQQNLMSGIMAAGIFAAGNASKQVICYWKAMPDSASI